MVLLLGFIALILSYIIHLLLKKWYDNGHYSVDVGSEESWFGRKPKGDNENETEIRPFTIHVSDNVLSDLSNRLENARIAPSLTGSNFEYGFNSVYLSEIVNYWKSNYSWRKQEEILNRYPHFKTKIEGLDVHYMQVKPDIKDDQQLRVVPLLILHGWPGSFAEFYKLIPLLTSERQNHDFVFEVICPSIPGFGFSDSPQQRAFTMRAAGRIFVSLMNRLGHSKFYVQGGDWGAVIALNMAKFYPQRILGVHVNYFAFDFNFEFAVKYAFASVCPFLLSKQDYNSCYPIKKKIASMVEESGYFHIQSTRPDTLAYALNDSPVGLAAYLLEKYALWTDTDNKHLVDGGLTKKFTLDELLTIVMIYWINGNISSTHRLYKESFYDEHWSYYSKIPITVPCGITNCLNELPAPKFFIPKNKVKNLIFHKSHEKGGHFLALEEPLLLADDIWTFVKTVRKKEISQLIQKRLKLK